MEISSISQMSGFSNIKSIGADAKGSNVVLKTSNPLHFTGNASPVQNDDVVSSFGDMLSEMIGKTNNLQVESEGLTKKMIYEPESVDIHSVMIAQQKAEVAMTFTKSVRDEALRAYRELMNLR
jgi:flagellar hook-basal body complex protein FliE